MASSLLPGESREEYKARMAAYQRAYRAKRKADGKPLPERTPEARRNHDWWKHYKLRPRQVFALWESQNRKCAVCLTSIGEPGASRATHIDHDHATQAVRGILCGHCNLALGHAKDNPARLRAMAAYLERQSS